MKKTNFRLRNGFQINFGSNRIGSVDSKIVFNLPFEISLSQPRAWQWRARCILSWHSPQLALTSVGTHLSWHSPQLALASVGTHLSWHSPQLALGQPSPSWRHGCHPNWVAKSNRPRPSWRHGCHSCWAAKFGRMANGYQPSLTIDSVDGHRSSWNNRVI